MQALSHVSGLKLRIFSRKQFFILLNKQAELKFKIYR